MGKAPGPPDFTSSDWKILYYTDFYYHPEKEIIFNLKETKPVLTKDQKLKKSLKNFWFARGINYEHANHLVGGSEVRIFNKLSALKFWGLLNEKENWIRAVLKDEEWIVSGSDDDLELEFETSLMGTINKVLILLNGKEIKQIKK